jgi:hypothetical protein
MPISLQQLATNRADATIDFGDGATLCVGYYPQRVTAQMLADYTALERIKTLPNDRALAIMTGLSDTLLALLASWDLVESIAEDGTPGPTLPLDHDHIAGLGFAIQVQIMNGVIEAMQRAGESRAPGAPGSVNEPLSGATSSAMVA